MACILHWHHGRIHLTSAGLISGHHVPGLAVYAAASYP